MKLGSKVSKEINMATKNNTEPVILIVDDDPIYISFWKRILPDVGITRFVATSDPREAEKILTTRHCTVLISDIIMPYIRGYELAQLAKERNPEGTIILTTAFDADLSRFDLGDPRFHLLHKPYTNLSELKRFLKHVIRGEDSIDSFSEDSFSENTDYPRVMEWKL